MPDVNRNYYHTLLHYWVQPEPIYYSAVISHHLIHDSPLSTITHNNNSNTISLCLIRNQPCTLRIPVIPWLEMITPLHKETNIYIISPHPPPYPIAKNIYNFCLHLPPYPWWPYFIPGTRCILGRLHARRSGELSGGNRLDFSYRIIPNKGTTLIRAPPIVWPKQRVPKITKVCIDGTLP